jgi:splicing factor 3B subunit 1
MGPGILPFLKEMVEIIATALVDEQQKVRMMCALALSGLAEAAHPYGIESFDSVLRPLWKGIKQHRGKGLAAFLKAIGFIIPLMEENHANHYTREVMPILIREFQSPDEEMKKIVLKVVKQCCGTSGVSAAYVRESVLPEFFKNFWIRRMALDRRNYMQVVETTEELANKVGTVDVIERIVDDLKDDSEVYRRMVMEAITKIVENLGLGEVDQRLEERLIDGVLYSFQEQSVDSNEKDNAIMLDGFGTVIRSLGTRCKPYLKQIAGTIKWRLNNKSSSVRMQAADLIGKIAVVMKACGEDQLMGHLGVVLYEYLGEEYPEVLGSILSALEAIVTVIGMAKMTPPIRDLLPRLTPILRNRHEKVQEAVVSLVGRIADRGAEHVHAKEWMRICFELLEMLKAPKKSIRRAAVSTFGYISRGIGPQDVLHTLLNNLKVQDRQNRVCTTIAIAIVAESCGPFTVLPAIMNEYRVCELNIQNGTLKALSFMMEYVGPMAADYIYAITPMLEDALQDRDNVKRQTAMATIRHLALGVSQRGCEDALLHLLNFVWPNIFEDSPHVQNACMDAIDGLTVSLGPNVVLQYLLAGLFHPARRVREKYWKIYNNLYVYASHSMVAAYPSLKECSDERNNYDLGCMDVFI